MSTELTSNETQSTPRDAGVTVLRALVLCDLVDSTALLEELGDQAAAELMRRHDRLSRALLQRHGGQEIDKTDGFLILFERPAQAVAFALNYHLALSEFEAVENVRLRARVGIHVGEVLLWDNSREDVARGAKPVDVEGLAKPMAARLMALAGPGQTLMSGLAYALAERSQMELGSNIQGLRWLEHGTYRFKGLLEPVTVWEVGVQGLAPFRPPVSSDKALRVLPWWRRGAGIGIAAGLLVAAVATPLYLSMRAQPAIAFAPRDWVVIGDLKNLTSDPALREPLETAFRVSLEQSRFVNVVPDLKVRQSLARMNRPRDAAVDRETGAEVALREGARALIVPTVTEVGGRVRVSAEVIDPNTQTTVYAESADGRGAESALASMDSVTRELRGRLGEAIGAIEGESQPLDKVTTGNIDALRAYSLGVRAESTARGKEAIALYQRATALDPRFALAHAGIGRIKLAGDDREGAREYFEKALSLTDRLAARERLYLEALSSTLGPVEPMLEQWQTLGTMYPDYYAAHANYALFAFTYANRSGDAADAARRALSNFSPRLGNTHYLLGTLALAQDDFEAADRHLAAARELDGDGLRLVHADALAARRQFARAEQALKDVRRSGVDANDLSIEILRICLPLDQGRLAEASSVAAEAIAAADRVGPLFGGVYRGIALSLESFAPPTAYTEHLHDYLRAALSRAEGNGAEQRQQAAFEIMLVAWLAATASDNTLAREALVAATPMIDSGATPVSLHMLATAQAALSIADGRAGEAAAALQSRLDGTELYITRVTYALALAAASRHSDAESAFDWLANHRGRAWGEYNSYQMLRGLNVAWSTLALLHSAELKLAAGRMSEASAQAARFEESWRRDELPPPLAARLQALTNPDTAH
jgi:putative peptide modification system cyclase